MKNSNKGFTLLELLISLAISAVVVMGAYAMFSSVLTTREATEKANNKNTLLITARHTFKSDLLQMYQDSLTVDNSGKNAIVTFRTNNSIKLEKAVPVTVKYYVDDVDNWLVREETNTDLSYQWELRLMPNVADFLVLSHNGYRFTEEYDNSDTILQFNLSMNGVKYQFIAGCGFTSDSFKSASGGGSGGGSTAPVVVTDDE